MRHDLNNVFNKVTSAMRFDNITNVAHCTSFRASQKVAAVCLLLVRLSFAAVIPENVHNHNCRQSNTRCMPTYL